MSSSTAKPSYVILGSGDTCMQPLRYSKSEASGEVVFELLTGRTGQIKYVCCFKPILVILNHRCMDGGSHQVTHW